MSLQPIGYNPALFAPPPPPLPIATAIGTPTPDTPNPTDSYLGGTIWTGFGQAPAANSFAPITGLNAT
jgi:hypothetical protein